MPMDSAYLIPRVELFGSTIDDALDNFLTKCVMEGWNPITLVEYSYSTFESYKVIYICSRITEYGLVIIASHEHLFRIGL